MEFAFLKGSKRVSAYFAAVLLGGVPLAAEEPELPVAAIPTFRVQPIEVQPLVEPSVGTPVSPASLHSRQGFQPRFLDGSSGEGRGWRLLLGVAASVVYDDNIFITNTDEESDVLFTISPSIGVAFGDEADSRNNLFLIYTPSFVAFADNSDQNTIEHALDLTFLRVSERWRITGNAAFRALSGAETQIGERVDRRNYVGGLKLNRLVSEKTSFEIGFAGNYTDYDEFSDTLDLLNHYFLDYAITGKTSLGLGFAVGFAKSEGGPNQVYEQLNVRASWSSTSKVTLNAQAGVEFRQVDGGDNQVDPVFSLGALYTPFESTSISVEGYRRIRPSSVFSNANYTVTGASLSARQRFLHRLFAVVSGGYEHSDYQTIADGTDFGRDDNYFFLRSSIETNLGHWGTLEVFGEYRNNESSLDTFEFVNRRVGIQVGVTF